MYNNNSFTYIFLHLYSPLCTLTYITPNGLFPTENSTDQAQTGTLTAEYTSKGEVTTTSNIPLSLRTGGNLDFKPFVISHIAICCNINIFVVVNDSLMIE